MLRRTAGPSAGIFWLAGAAGLVALMVITALDLEQGYLALYYLLVVAVLAALAFLAWQVEPAWFLGGALILSSFNGNWGEFGLPPNIAPDRLLLLAGLAAVLLRAPRVRDRPSFELKPIHWMLALTLLYVIGSALWAGTYDEGATFFSFADRMAVPFGVFLLAPFALRTEGQRRILLGMLVGFGGYLGLTAFFESNGPDALVWPGFINDPAVGIHEGRARGPSLEAAANGFALYVGAVAGVMAVATWSSLRWRVLAGAVTLLCGFGMLATVTRSVWLAGALATAVTMLAVRELRRFILPAAVGGVAMVLVAFAVDPTLEDEAGDRAGAERSVWDRENSNATALAMIKDRPVFGFGFETYDVYDDDYIQLLEDVPITAVRPELHNVFLSLGSELGLVGGLLFLGSFLFAIGGAIVTRGPPELYPWRAGLLAVAIAWAVIAAFVPFGQVFSSLAPWVLAAVIVGGSARPAPQPAAAMVPRLPTSPRAPVHPVNVS
jgi:putative inorganic carbon (hco3(-)) transporter